MSLSSTLFLIIVLFVYGSILSSFLSLVGYRVPLGISIVKPDSMCGSCKIKLGARDLIPVFSYILNKGKCRNCKVSYGSFHLKLEILLGILFIIFGFYILHYNNYIIDLNFTLQFLTIILGLSIFNINIVSLVLHKKILIKTNVVLYSLMFIIYLICILLFKFYASFLILLIILILLCVLGSLYAKGVDTSV